MSVSDMDWELLERRLQSIERSIEMLKAVFGEPKKYVGGNGDVAYVLEEGSLTDSGTEQIWRNKDES